MLTFLGKSNEAFFLEVMTECIPQRLLPNWHNLPWLSKSLVRLITRRNMLFNSAKQRVGKRLDVDTNTFETGWLLKLRTAKSSFFKNLNPEVTKNFGQL